VAFEQFKKGEGSQSALLKNHQPEGRKGKRNRTDSTWTIQSLQKRRRWSAQPPCVLEGEEFGGPTCRGEKAGKNPKKTSQEEKERMSTGRPHRPREEGSRSRGMWRASHGGETEQQNPRTGTAIDASTKAGGRPSSGKQAASEKRGGSGPAHRKKSGQLKRECELGRRA